MYNFFYWLLLLYKNTKNKRNIAIIILLLLLLLLKKYYYYFIAKIKKSSMRKNYNFILHYKSKTTILIFTSVLISSFLNVKTSNFYCLKLFFYS